MMPNASDLIYFIEVSKTLNFSRAAERIGITQPSLTLAIRRLEDSLGSDLFIRHKKGVNLTRAGKELLASSSRLVHLWEETKAKISSSSLQVEGMFTLGCHVSVAGYSLAKFLPYLVKHYPKLNLQLRHDLSRRIAEDIISSRIDIGIVVNPVKHPDLVIQRLCYDEVALWCLDEKQDHQNPRSGNGVLIYDPELLQSQAILKKLTAKGLKISRTITSSSLELIAQLTASGGGIGVLPTRLAKQAPYAKVKRVSETPIFKDEICLLYRVENRSIPAIKVVSEAIRKAFTD